MNSPTKTLKYFPSLHPGKGRSELQTRQMIWGQISGEGDMTFMPASDTSIFSYLSICPTCFSDEGDNCTACFCPAFGCFRWKVAMLNLHPCSASQYQPIPCLRLEEHHSTSTCPYKHASLMTLGYTSTFDATFPLIQVSFLSSIFHIRHGLRLGPPLPRHRTLDIWICSVVQRGCGSEHYAISRRWPVPTLGPEVAG